MSDQEVKSKKGGRGRGRAKAAAKKGSGTSGSGTLATSGSNKKGTTSKKNSTIKGIRAGRGRGRIRIEDSDSEDEIVTSNVPEANVCDEEPVKVNPEIASDDEEKGTDTVVENLQVIKEEKPSLITGTITGIITGIKQESYGSIVIPSIQSPSLMFKDEIDDDITSTLSFVGPKNNVPLHNSKPLNWSHRVNLIGDKCPSPRIHICEKCERPILLYGRLIPCKHVFCYDCAKTNDSLCLRCNDKVLKVEKNKLGAVYMCTYSDCRRTYLSHRDLQAHISHRHLRRSTNLSSNCPSLQQQNQQQQQVAPSGSHVNTGTNSVTSPSTPSSATISSLTSPYLSRSKTNNANNSNSVHSSSSSYHSVANNNHNFIQCNIPVVSSTRPNLITIPIHEESTSLNHQSHHSSSQANKTKLIKNPVISGRSPTFIPQTLVNSLPRANLQWPTSVQASSSLSSSFTSPTSQAFEGYINPVTNQWTLPLLSDPRQTATVNRHFYQ